MIEIAFSSSAPHFSQEHHIFGDNYIFEFKWFECEAYWVMHIYDANEKPIALGLRLIPGWPVYVNQHKNLTFFLFPKTANATLSLTTLQSDFMLVVQNESL